MLRDLNFLRRNSGKNTDTDEPENVPVNGKFHESSVAQMGADSSSRPPLSAIRDPVQNPSKREQESAFKNTKLDRTPTKVNATMKTPEKQGGLARNRYGWASDSKHEVKNGNMNMNITTSTPRSCRTVGRAVSSGYSECNLTPNTQCNSTQNTPTKSVNKPPNPGLSSRPPISGGVRNNGSFAALSRGFQNTYPHVNTIEVPHFDLKEDPSFWMDHNVQVLIRIRPLNNMELSAQGYNRCLKQDSAQCLTWVGQPETRFKFDHVACETIDQETLFRMVGLPMVENCLSGYNSCIFAYGQTGSGKTHTMLGEINELEVKPSPYRGMTPRMFEFLFARIIAEEESRMDERLTYNCKCSFLEIYNEQITDLLDPSSTNLQLREDVKTGVYVENLTECEVHTVGDILRLLSRGSANRRVAATNMNRESSRSHSVFTCVIESRWEKDSTSNLRFARLNLVDLAGSERQKTSGAEGERLKEAASINKSLSTLGHVIMVLVEGANARTRHVPYRDSRLTFLLQDSLGGNSKTMIIANVSPSICSATETLNTLKFAQRAKLIQNNAVVNEDASGDIMALQQQIQLLKEELATLKRNNISRSLTFGPKVNEEATQEQENDVNGHDNKTLKVSAKQLKSLESSLTGALRREQMSETSIKQLEAEIEHLNRLVRQREDDNKCTKMMLKFREDKIHRMKSLVAGSIPSDSYMLEENKMLTEEIQMLRAKVDRNPEVTRFALENIRLLEQLRRFQDFYEEGEREMLLKEVSEMRNQLVLFLDENKQHDNIQKEAALAHDNKENISLRLELQKSQEELETCRNNLNSCLEKNEKLCKEISDLNTLLQNTTEVIKDPISETHVNKLEEVMNLQLESDILKMILKEKTSCIKSTEEKHILIKKQYEDMKQELDLAKSVIEALETQQLASIHELEALGNTLEVQNDNISNQDSQDDKLKKMKDSLEKAKRSNNRYKSDREFHASNEEEMDEVRKQVEAETAEVIVCLQEEVCSLQEQLEQKEKQWELLSNEIHDVITTCHESLDDITHDDVTVFEELQMITRSVFEKESRIRELKSCLEDMKIKGSEMEGMLMSLRGATLVMTEAHQEDCRRKDRVISQLIKEIKETSVCAMGAFVVVKRFSEMKDGFLEVLKEKEGEIEELKRSYVVDIFEAKKKKDMSLTRRDDTITLLKKELETALGSLNGVKSEMARLHSEKEFVRLSEKQNQESVKTLMHQVIALQSVVDYFEKQIGGAMGSLDHKIQTVEELFQESYKSCSQKRKLYELELMDAKVNAAQQAAESCCVLSKFEEAHYTIKEADVMINELLIANETMKLEIESLKKKEAALVNDTNTLTEIYESDLMGMKKEVNDLESMIMETKTFVDKDLMPTVSDSFLMKSEVHDSSKLIHSWLEDIWSDIIMNDLLHVCHMGILMETVTELKDRNLKSRKEMEMCREIEEKLMMDMFVKEIEVIVVSSVVKEMDSQKMDLENENNKLFMVLEKFKGSMIMSDVDMQLKDSILLDMSAGFKKLDSEKMDVENENCKMFMVLEKFKENMVMGDVDMQLKDSILLDMSAGFKKLDSQKMDLENENCKMFMVLEKFKENMIMGNVDSELKDSIFLEKEADVALLNKDVKAKEVELLILSSRLEEMDSQRKNLENKNISMLIVLEKLKENMIISIVEKEAEVACLQKDFNTKEIELLTVSSEQKQIDSQKKNLENVNNSMLMALENVKENMVIAMVDMQLKDSMLLEKEAEVAYLQKDVKEKENELLIVSSGLKQMDSEKKNLENANNSLLMVLENLKEKMIMADVDMQLKDSILLEREAEVAYLQKDVKEKENELLIVSSVLKQIDSEKTNLENVNISMLMVLENLKENMIMADVDMQLKDSILKDAISENNHLENESKRKDKVLEGLLFDLQLSQESSSKNQDQEHEIEKLTSSLESLKKELDEKIVKSKMLESDVSRESELVKSLFSEIQTLKDALKAKETTGMELMDAKKANERLESELEALESEIESRTCELVEVRKELEMAQALAEENEAIATESKQIAETSRLYAEEKEEEVKIYEKSVEELDSMVTALENQVDLVKGDAERQRLQREELELEFHAFKQQISSDSDMKRILNEKEESLQEILQRVELLEKEIANKDKEIVQHKAHISELNLHAESQAREYKQTFKTLEAMADQVKPDVSVIHITSSPSKKLEKNGSRTRGSGSPFKCIGLGLGQQIKSERDEELSNLRKRIEELESLAASRQKEIFALNAKLAMSGSMTHDVLRDLLGIKLDMTTYSSLMNGHQIEEITEKARIHNAEVHFQEEEVIKLKEQLNELVMERKGWLEEIERKQSEMITSQVALEKLRQRDRLLKTENEMFKTEISNLKMKVMELETEVKKLSGQQNIQQRIHHHLKIKEENNLLKNQNDELSRKLRRRDDILSRVKEEYANLLATCGKDFSDVESELQLNEKLKVIEEERDQVAQKLAALCTTILKAAGVTRPGSDVSISMVEEALEELQGRVATLERELQDLQYKNRISNERVRLSGIMPQKVEGNRQTNSKASRSPFLSSLDR